MSDSPELLKPSEVTDDELQIRLGNLKSRNEELQIELGNLKAENQRLQAEYAKLLEFSAHITNKLRQEVQELRSQLATERADREEVEGELFALKQESATVIAEFPEPADLLNRLKAKRKKSRADLADINAILGLLAEEYGSNPV
ncbi:hypothetical protein [Microcoleus sp. D3_18a_C4]|uniref:hypothetical protein n=1 Tax=Microcoleus sp. D3_18a_C4 TaxID=3055332 RepID=UPI002FD19262